MTREIERGTMEMLLSMPITPLEVMLGKILPYVLVDFLQASIIIGISIGVGLFNVPIFGSLPLLAVLSAAGMPRWAQWIGEFLSLTHYLRIVRSIMLKGSTLVELQQDALALGGLMLAMVIVAVLRFRRTLD